MILHYIVKLLAKTALDFLAEYTRRREHLQEVEYPQQSPPHFKCMYSSALEAEQGSSKGSSQVT